MPNWPYATEPAGGRPPDRTQNTVFPEGQIKLPWTLDPAVSWIDYRCWTETLLDAGMATHYPLPGAVFDPDTLATCQVGDDDVDSLQVDTGGVNVKANISTSDVPQRMANPRYRFIVRGYGMRVGYQIPIPGLKSRNGFTFIPDAVQRAYNVIVGNGSGVPIWYAEWELHYTIVGALNSDGALVPVPANPALHIRPDVELPDTIELPWTAPDQRHLYPVTAPPSPPPQPPGQITQATYLGP